MPIEDLAPHFDQTLGNVVTCLSMAVLSHTYRPETYISVYIRYFLQGSHQIYGRIQRIHTVLANPMTHEALLNHTL